MAMANTSVVLAESSRNSYFLYHHCGDPGIYPSLLMCLALVLLVVFCICWWPKYRRAFQQSGGIKALDPATIHAMLPTVLLFVILLVAMADNQKPKCGVPQHPFVGGRVFHEPVTVINTVVVCSGPVVPFIVFVVQCWVLPWNKLIDKQVVSRRHTVRLHDSFDKLLKGRIESWCEFTLAFWIFIVVLRMLTYGPVASYDYWFSDHIYLTTSMVAQLQMTLFLGHYACYTYDTTLSVPTIEVTWGIAMLILTTWLIIACILVETFVTAKYYHTIQADVAGFITGTVVFNGLAFWWIGKLRTSYAEEQAQEQQAREGYASLA